MSRAPGGTTRAVGAGGAADFALSAAARYN